MWPPSLTSVRVVRVSFTGELSYEVSVPWSYGAALWERLLELGQNLGVTPLRRVRIVRGAHGPKRLHVVILG